MQQQVASCGGCTCRPTQASVLAAGPWPRCTSQHQSAPVSTSQHQSTTVPRASPMHCCQCLRAPTSPASCSGTAGCISPTNQQPRRRQRSPALQRSATQPSPPASVPPTRDATAAGVGSKGSGLASHNTPVLAASQMLGVPATWTARAHVAGRRAWPRFTPCDSTLLWRTGSGKRMRRTQRR